MDGSPSSIIMLGFSNGTFSGSPSLMVTMGYGIADEIPDPIPSVTITGRRTTAIIPGKRTTATITGKRTGDT